jgi:arginase family enzyme
MVARPDKPIPKTSTSSTRLTERVWLHIDADFLDDNVMPAVDWRPKGA